MSNPFTVAIPNPYRNSLHGRLGAELRRELTWVDHGPAHVAVGLPLEGELVTCATWPGEEAALALVEAGWQCLQDRRDMERLHAVGRALASEQDLGRLLDLILAEARQLLDAEAGSLYLVEGEGDERSLCFAHTQNAAIEVPYHRFHLPITPESMAGFVACTGLSLNIRDVYELQSDSPFQFNPAFDRRTGYRTQSMLCVPLQDATGEVLGVLQLINRLDLSEGRRRVVAFRAQDQRLAQSLAGQAGVAVRNARLREDIERLFEGFVNASVTAIEQRDPVTSGHSGRVAALTVGLAEVVDRVDSGTFGRIRFDGQALRELRYASLLHDFGKVGVREQVLVKSKKLDPARLELLLQRLAHRRDSRALLALQERWKAGVPFDPALWSALVAAEDEETTRLVRLVLGSNEPAILPEDSAKELGALAALEMPHWQNGVIPIFSPADIDCLRIRKGSLSDEERLEIESHVTHTFRFLAAIPWTRDLSGVPDIAYAHHERLNGMGYPRRLTGNDIPLQSRIMAISDVFDALTAQDRPYKAAVPVERSLDILRSDAKTGHLDADLLDLFVEAKVYTLTTGGPP